MTTVTDPLVGLFRDYPLSTLAVVVIVLVLTIGLAWLIVRQAGGWLAQAAMGNDPPQSLILALSFLTLVAIVGALITKAESAWTLAATGLGALAASLTSYFQLSRERMAFNSEMEELRTRTDIPASDPEVVSDSEPEAADDPELTIVEDEVTVADQPEQRPREE